MPWEVYNEEKLPRARVSGGTRAMRVSVSAQWVEASRPGGFCRRGSKATMNSRARLAILMISAPIVLLVVAGGFMSKATAARDETYRPMRVFEDVVRLILDNYVETVNSDHIMRGAMHGLAEGLDADSAYLTAAQAAAFASSPVSPKGNVGLELTRQYYLRVIAARDGSPAARAGLRTGDFIRAIDGKPTRDMSVLLGTRLLHGAPGSKVTLAVLRGNAAELHNVDLVREMSPAPSVSSRTVRPGIVLVRVPAFGPDTAGELRAQIGAAREQGAQHVLIDLRNSAEGALDDGIAAARLFVKKGVLVTRETRTGKMPISAGPNDGSVAPPVLLLVDNGTSGAAELFAAALVANGPTSLVGERTLGRTAGQELVKLPDGSALWLSTTRYLTAHDAVIHEKGLKPEVAVEGPNDVEFGAEAPTTDPILDKALEVIGTTKAAA
jgi:carboxyl-terminal processing protease